MPSMDEVTRTQSILLELERNGRVLVVDLARKFNVSEVTIRKDLDTLQRHSMLRRVRGGAVPVGDTDEGSFEMRIRHSARAKRAIAARARSLVQPGDVIAIDSSTTCYYLATELLDIGNLVVITNGLRTAELFLERSTAMVVMPGGVLRRSAASMVSPIGDVLAGRGRIDKGFFGLMGLSTEFGMLDLVAEEAQTKRYLAAACNELFGMFDSSKVGRFAMHSFAPTDRITALVTDEGAPVDFAEEWQGRGVRVHRVTVPADSDLHSAHGHATVRRITG